MSFYQFNHTLMYRPLIGGTAIFNPRADRTGTTGLIATDGQRLWVISAYHILARRDMSGLSGPEPIYQPGWYPSETPVAQLDPVRTDTALDAAAALIEPSVAAEAWILGIGPPAAPIIPAVGMRVIKSGIRTGVTEGVVTAVAGDQVTIGVVPGFPAKYDLSSIGDSGSVWVEAGTHAAIALHSQSVEGTRELAIGPSMTAVMGSLGLAVL